MQSLPAPFPLQYQSMITEFTKYRTMEQNREQPSYTFGSRGGLVAMADYSNPDTYNPPGFAPKNLDAAKRVIARRGIPEPVWKFVEDTCAEYDIDKSHGLEHACRVAAWCSHITAEICTEINLQELNIGIHDLQDVAVCGGFLHDAIDDKYIPCDIIDALQCKLRDILVDNYDDYVVDAIFGAINCISFSTRYSLLSAGKYPIPTEVYAGARCIPVSNLCRVASHIIADADMLDAYNPMRCRDFRLHKDPATYANWETDGAVRRKLYAGVGGIIRNRVLYYRDIYMFTETAKKFAKPLHDLATGWAVIETADIPDCDLTYHPSSQKSATSGSATNTAANCGQTIDDIHHDHRVEETA